MSRFCVCLLLTTITVSMATHAVRASDENATAEIVDTIRGQTEAADARATLERIPSSIEYRDIYQMLRAGLNENIDYPVPNALVDRILTQFSNIQQGDMDGISDYLVQFDNDRFDRFDGILSFLQHPEIEATGLFKVVTNLARHRDSVSALKKMNSINPTINCPTRSGRTYLPTSHLSSWARTVNWTSYWLNPFSHISVTVTIPCSPML